MNTLEIARRLAEYQQTEDAQKAYMIFLQQENKEPMEELEAASYLFFSKGDYQVAYSSFVSLYNRGLFQDELMEIMMQAFYLPNLHVQKKRYEEGCASLCRYPYIFRTDFPAFDELSIQFFPFDDNGFIPFYPKENRFGTYVNFNNEVIDRWFFKDLEKPVLAEDVYSQYQLEYLNDNVRKSEWVGKENHIYLHYTDWAVFCAHLQCLSMTKILRDKKFVFLIGDEISRYPIDFKQEFGIDYGQYPVKPIGIREVTRLIWHTQLSAHNGGDFFNEIFHGHPNLLAYESVMFDSVTKQVGDMRRNHKKSMRTDVEIYRQLAQIKHPTEKDCLVALFLHNLNMNSALDPAARIVPALFFQPHFSNMIYRVRLAENGGACVLESDQYDAIRKSPLFNQFKYIKTFTPMRRITTSYAATVRFMVNDAFKEGRPRSVTDAVIDRVLNRSFMVDPDDRLYRDSVLVRFEDGKLNPKATFTALAEFLDIPYTHSMTYCSTRKGIDTESYEGNARGFDPITVYRTYDDFANDEERAFLEYFLRDVYKQYHYDFHYYKGEEVDETWAECVIGGFSKINHFILESCQMVVAKGLIDKGMSEVEANEKAEKTARDRIEKFHKNRLHIAKILMSGLRFFNRQGQPLRMMTLLKVDPALLEQPLYH